MIAMAPYSLDADRCSIAVDELAAFLGRAVEHEEAGPGGLQEFFSLRPDLLLLMGDCFFPSMGYAAYQSELSIFGEFRADFAVCNAGRSKFLFVEFEDAKADSIFREKTRGDKNTTYEWSSRFEHGFSQVVDWHFRIDDYRRTSKIEEHFGSRDIAYKGLLVIGRDRYLSETGTSERLRWRCDKTAINSRQLECLTFDALLAELQGRMDVIQGIAAGRIA